MDMREKQNSTVVYEFRNEVYPFPIFVGLGVSDKTIRDFFTRAKPPYGFEVGDNLLKGKDALTVPVIMWNYIGGKIVYKHGIFVNINANNVIDAGVITKEACRVADWLCMECGVRFGGKLEEGEAYAYLVGMAAQFISQVIKHAVPQTVKKWTPAKLNRMYYEEFKDKIRRREIKLDDNGNPIYPN